MPARLFMSSGDLVADRRYDFARDLQLCGDLDAAADLLRQALELAPDFTSAWFTLGDLCEQLDRRDDAIHAYREAARCDADDRHGANLRLIRLDAAPLTSMPAGYVRTLFDQYAPRFEASLVGDLGYRGPDLLFKAVLVVRAAARRPALFRRAIDLGCGTGLAARAFASNVDAITGFDLAPQMIARARDTGLYARLAIADLVDGLRDEPDGSADLLLAADAAVYLDDLAPMLHEAARVVASDGLIALTLETHSGDGVVLGRGLRYAHSARHLRDATAAAGLTLTYLEHAWARHEDGVPAPGLVAVAMKS